MRDITEIDKTLLALHSLYDSSQRTGCDNKTLNYFCKLALIELCGWIEQAMDGIIIESAERNRLKGISQIELLVNSTYSFEYKKAFRPLILAIVGYKNCEFIESKLESSPDSAYQAMLSGLSNLRPHRNTHAHTHLQFDSNVIPTPSWLRGQLKVINKGLKEIEAEMISLGY